MARSASLLIAVFLLLYIVPLGVRPLIAPDETRYGEISREMIASGDWVVPHLDGLRYFEKPVLGYWLNAAAMCLFGENEFAVRLPSALAAGLTALLLGLWASRFAVRSVPVGANNRSPSLTTPYGVTTSAVFLLSFEVFAIGVFCVLDSLFSLFVTASILFFYSGHESRSRRTLIASGVCCGLAFLTKGPLGVVIPAIVLAPFVLWERRFKATLKVIWLPIMAAILVAIPWCVMIHLREPDFWHYFFWVEHIDRFIRPNPGQHALPFWYYLPVIVAGTLPWPPLTGTIIQGLRGAGSKNPMIRLAVCWLALPFLFFSLSSGKLGTYILVCFPALAFLIAVGMLECLRRTDTKGFVVGTGIVAATTGVLLVALIVCLLMHVLPVSSESQGQAWLLAGAGLLIWCVLASMAVRRIRTRADDYSPVLLYWLGPVLLWVASWQFVVGAVASPEKIPGAFLLSNNEHGTDKNCTLVCDNGLAASACWFYKRADILITEGQGEYEYGLGYDDSKYRYIESAQLKEMIARLPAGKRIGLVTTVKHYSDFGPELPPPTAKNTMRNLVFAEFGGRGE
jgi:4-amino-4-deoxy-L-arabinose transferase